VQYQGKSLETIRIKPGKWSHSARFTELEVCHEWRIKPTEFWNEWSEIDRAYAIAYTQTKSRIQALENQVQEDQLERQKKRKK